MKIAVDIPDAVYQELERRANTDGETVDEIVRRDISVRLAPPRPAGKLRRLKHPPLNEGVPGSLKLDNETIYGIIGFP